MAEVAALNMFPITGIRPVSLEQAEVTSAGIQNDRRFVLFDKEGGRISTKEHPELLQFSASYSQFQDLRVTHETAGDLIVPNGSDKGSFDIDEFGDRTPVTFMGKPATRYFSSMLGRYVSLGRKTAEWMNGYHIHPAHRKNAPLHLVFQSTVTSLQTETIKFGSDRFRPNIVITGTEPEAEQAAIGGTIHIGGLAIAITRATERCPVPGLDPTTGQNLKDVPKLYRNFPRGPEGKKPTMGVYGYAVLNAYETATIAVGDPVTM